jgi:PAS domain S-box-containing protein
MLGPIETLLAEDHGPLTRPQRNDAEILQRNAGRLLKLVNALLDFSRIEAGRAQATYAPTDVSGLTRELAAAFRSAIEQAGLRFDVACEAIDQPVFLDRDMWEKIVLNLLSNALKFTLSGSIRVELRRRGDAVELAIADTGPGIPEPERSRIFERFHRVEGGPSRTHEGTGIGLALTHELVALHGGTIHVESAAGGGSRFIVRVPTGSTHLAPDRIVAAPPIAVSHAASPFVEEAARWLLQPASEGTAPRRPPHRTIERPDADASRKERLLIVDDNADMREYLSDLLRNWRIETACDGVAALQRARADPPSLIVTDVMMPRLDGFELLKELRNDARTRSIPVLMLSARAGEEARVSGLDAGADDYVIKPFGARELVARVDSLLKLSRARREAELQKEHLRALFMQAPTPIIMLRGPDHVIELANPLACVAWGLAEADILGQPLFDALPDLREQPFEALLDDVMRTGVPYVGKETPSRFGRYGNGTSDTAFFNVVYAPLRGVDGRIEGILGIAFDVTDEVTARNQMDQLRAAAESANRTKDEFLAMLGHELRNPLAPILTALQLMTLKGPGTLVKERTIIDRQVRHLVRLVDDLLDVSRIARGKIDLRRESVDLADVVASAVEAVSPLLEQRTQQLLVSVPRGLTVVGDLTRLTQIVMNVLSNAAKYTQPNGTIEVGAVLQDEVIDLRVKDNGIGISSDMLPHVFDMFTQERQTIHRADGGLGLGLTIVKSLVELHGGTVSALSDGVGQGSEIAIRLPKASRAAASSAGADDSMRPIAPSQHGRRLLIVDDNVDAARTMGDALRIAGYDTRVSFDGPAALDAAAKFEPDVVLLDLGLPLMDGYEVAREMVAARAGRAPILVAVTGYGQVSDQERTRAAGFSSHVVKPIDVPHLLGVLERLLTEASAN